MRNIKKIIILIIMMLMVFSINCVKCYASSCSQIEQSASDFKNEGQKQLNEMNEENKKKNKKDPTITEKISNEVAPIVNMLISAGILIISICMVILGIQWVMAKASPEEQAKLKNKFVALAVSAGVLFGSFTIWEILVTILDSIDG